jgi:small subunit ribosomal protein S1
MNIETLPTNQDLTEQEPTSQDSTFQEAAEQNLEEYLAEDKYDYQTPKRGAIHNGVVIEIGEHGAIVDAGFKRDGLVPIEDLERLDKETFSSIQAGDTVLVSVEKPQDKDGRLILSVYHALVQEDWIKAEKMMESGEIYEGQIAGHNRGGLLVPFGRIRGFVPASHIVGMPRGLQGEERRQRLEEMVGEEVGLKIIEVDRQRRRLIFSQRQARRVWQKMQRERVMDELSEGNTRHGVVTGLTDFGAFVDLGGADGLIHISELSWRQVNDPREVVQIGDEVDVYILSLDWERKRIALSLKRLQPNPWTQAAERYKPDQLVEGQISRVLDFGAFVKLDLGIEGLLHVSEMSGMSQLNPSDIVRSGEKVLVKIISIDTQKERIALSARQVHRDEWERWMAEHKIAPQAKEKEAEATKEVEEEVAAPEAEVAEVIKEETTAPEVEAAEEENTGTML